MKFKIPILYKLLLLAVIVGGTSSLAAQGWLSRERETIRRGYARDTKKDNFKVIVFETDSSIQFSLRDTSWQHLDHIYFFNNNGKADKQTVISGCDSCFQKYLKVVMDNKRWGWIAINDSFYISKFSKRIALEIHPSSFSYSFIHLDWSRKQYDALLPKQKSIRQLMNEIEMQQ